MSNLKFTFSGESKNATKFVGKARDFEIAIDEPPVLGGNDEAPNPVEYTLASLAGCLNVVAYIVAKERNITIESLKIDLEGNLNPAKFLGQDMTNRAGFQNIDVKVYIKSDVSPEVLADWLRVVKERCPVTDNLANDTPINVELIS